MKNVNCIRREMEYLEKGATELFPTVNDLIPSIFTTALEAYQPLKPS